MVMIIKQNMKLLHVKVVLKFSMTQVLTALSTLNYQACCEGIHTFITVFTCQYGWNMKFSQHTLTQTFRASVEPLSPFSSTHGNCPIFLTLRPSPIAFHCWLSCTFQAHDLTISVHALPPKRGESRHNNHISALLEMLHLAE